MQKMIVLFLILAAITVTYNVQCVEKSSEIYTPNKTSGALLIHFAEKMRENVKPSEKMEAEAKYLLTYDVYIKARSYALLNKVFFIFSLIAGIAVLVWPSMSIVFKNSQGKWEWIKSATVQTTVTAIAALMFSFYTQYKDKQTYAETLMRYLVFSKEPVSYLSGKITDELAKIDHGFSFNSILNKSGADQSDTRKEAGSNEKGADTASTPVSDENIIRTRNGAGVE